ncbi:putative histone-lysine N-methyltransferase PRDM6 [Notolabrus celidotus]|uniref:putative histone-lysine N-methyltransferase PRDM6 n=1 Tax=Notolabrus celidotus TaxID=1203425 RepID=UPI00148F5F0B|nr:putative histone-lysine N-methyltransferase PRDM6 [Notolabrus celidotus]
MLKPGDPSGSAFLKVDPSYLQHWQQLFPQAQLKPPLAPPPPPPPPDRLSIPLDGLRQSRLHSHLLASSHCTSSSSSTSSSALTPSSSISISTSAGISQLPVPQQIALFGQALAPVCGGPGGPGGDLIVVVPPENQQQGHREPAAVGLLHQAKDQSCVGVGVVSSSVKSGGGEEGGKGARFKLTSEELDYYLYGQQRMEIIPLSNHTGETNNPVDTFSVTEDLTSRGTAGSPPSGVRESALFRGTRRGEAGGRRRGRVKQEGWEETRGDKEEEEEEADEESR